MRILIVDDEPLILRMLQRVLGPFGTLSFAESAHEALALMAKDHFDTLLTDFSLGSDEAGRFLLDRVRVQFPDVRRILMSGHSVERLDELLLDGRIHAYLPKIFSRAQLLEVLGISPHATFAPRIADQPIPSPVC